MVGPASNALPLLADRELRLRREASALAAALAPLSSLYTLPHHQSIYEGLLQTHFQPCEVSNNPILAARAAEASRGSWAGSSLAERGDRAAKEH
jgi:hypothetical protein